RRRCTESAATPMMRQRWQAAAAFVLTLIAIAGTGLALAVSIRGPLRLRIGAVPIASVRDVWRPIAIAVLALALRIALARAVTFRVRDRVARTRETWRRLSPALRRDARMFYALLTLTGVWLSMGPPVGVGPPGERLPG